MSPADGAFVGDAVALRAAVAVVLPGGRSLLAFEGAALPSAGTALAAGDRRIGWTAEAWPLADGAWAGLALLDDVLLGPAELHDAAGRSLGTLAPAPRLDAAPEPLAAWARARGLSCRAAFDFLVRTLLADGAPPEAARWHRDFAAGFVSAAAEPDGFVEVLAVPECGGVFVQGWSVSLNAGPATLATLDGDLRLSAGQAAVFARDDILPPGRGFCFHSPDWRDRDPSRLDAVFLEEDGRLLRLDVVRGSVLRLGGAAATAHVAHMLPRLDAPPPALAAFRRVCRPRYGGEDTLSGTALPVAAAVDAAFQAPDGGILAMGWLLDPVARVERVILKSTKGLYAPLQDGWNALPRPDLHAGFASDPRFTRLLDGLDAQHGFLAYAPGRVDQVEGAEAYLELVLDDNTCLFRPVAVTRLDGRDAVPRILAAVPPADPNLDAIVGSALAPFLAGLPARARRLGAGAGRPIMLGDPGAAREVTAVMPVESWAQLQPVLALLAGTPDADALDLALVATRAVAADLGARLPDAFRFYGLHGRLVVAPDREGFAAQVEAGLAATQGPRVLVWSPAALPMEPGWLQQLVAEADALGRPNLLSPSLVYEDGSVCFGGGAAEGASCLGYPAAWLPGGPARAAPAGAAEVALVNRADLARAGGFAGRLLGDAFAHRDLARRLRGAGCGTWCSGSVGFWMLGGAAAGGPVGLVDKVDTALMRRSQEDVP